MVLDLLLAICGRNSERVISGGGFLGGGQSHESINRAAKQKVEIAGEFRRLIQRTEVYPLPRARTGYTEYFSRIGKKAAKARMKKLSPTERKRIATKAARARWRTQKGKN